MTPGGTFFAHSAHFSVGKHLETILASVVDGIVCFLCLGF